MKIDKLAFSVQDLDINELAWLHKHNQDNKGVYTVDTTVVTSGEISENRMNVTIEFEQWNVKAKTCLEELLTHFG